MNTPNTPNILRPSGPECAQFTALLPRFRQGLLAPADDTSLRAHLNTCTYCQAHLARYDQLDATLRAYVGSYTPTVPDADELVRMAVMQRNENAMYGNNRGDDGYHDSFADQDTVPSMQTYPPNSSRPPQPPRANQRRTTVLATIAAVLLVGLIAALFAVYGRGLGGTALGTSTATVPATETATPEATDTPAPTATPAPPNGVVNQGYPCYTDTSGSTSPVQIGDLRVATVGLAFAYPAYELSASLDHSKPFALPDSIQNPPNPPVNPGDGQAVPVAFTVCNTSNTASHILRGVTVAIDKFTSFSGSLNTYRQCDIYYQRPNGLNGGGCGGGAAYNEVLKAAFAANAAAGAQVTATQMGAYDSTSNPAADKITPLPIQLGPGQELWFSLTVTPPTVPGFYTFRYGLNYDGVTAATISTMEPVLIDTAAVKWNGQNCTSAQISQIPADSTAKYICAPQG